MTNQQQLWLKACLCLAGFVLLGWVDYALGEIGIGPIYLFLVAYVGWQFNTLAAAGLAAVVATLCRLWAYYLSGPKYSSHWILYENAATWLIVFFAAAYALMSYRRTLETHRRRLESLRRMLPVCHGCGSMRGPDGRWRSFEQLSSSPFPQVLECPDCADQPEVTRD